MDEKQIQDYWNGFRTAGNNADAYPEQPPEAWHFCDNREDADALYPLVLAGTKRATASLVSSYAVDGETVPVPGELSIITDWAGTPKCIIETTVVTCVPFRDVTPQFAAVEGEGDGSLEHWRRVHREAFSRELAGRGEAFHDAVEVVCEEFRVIHR